jgi:aspartate kinase
MSETQKWIIQKFGGTSLGKLLPTITGSIIPHYIKTNKIAVVCSAISGTTKSSGTTSLLLEAIDHAISSRRSQLPLHKTIDTIRDNHLELSASIFTDGDSSHSDLQKSLNESIKDDCEQLREFLLAAQV